MPLDSSYPLTHSSIIVSVSVNFHLEICELLTSHPRLHSTQRARVIILSLMTQWPTVAPLGSPSFTCQSMKARVTLIFMSSWINLSPGRCAVYSRCHCFVLSLATLKYKTFKKDISNLLMTDHRYLSLLLAPAPLAFNLLA